MSATIHFFIRTDRPQQDGSVQVYLIYTISSSLKTKISLKKSIPLKKQFLNLKPSEIAAMPGETRNELYCWDHKAERATKECPNYDRLNRMLDGEKKKTNDIILRYELLNRPLTVDDFKKEYCKGVGNVLFSHYFLDLFKDKNQIWSGETIRSYTSIVTKIQEFKPNLSLNGVSYKFLNDYENYMYKSKEEGGCGNCERTIGNNMKVLKTLLKIAIKNKDYHRENYPFDDYKVKETQKELTTRDYLEPFEIAVLEKLYENYRAPEKPIHELSVEDWKKRESEGIITPGEHRTLKRFLFSCYTGIRFRDIMALDDTKIFNKPFSDGNDQIKKWKWYIEFRMHKTSSPVFIPLLDKAEALLDLEKKGPAFEKISNQKINEHLESIQKKSGIDKKLTFHVSRHSFATVAFLYGVDENVVQKLLGHKNRKYTQIYTHISHNKLVLEMEKVNSGMNKLNMPLNSKPENQAKVLELLPMLSGLTNERLEQLKGFLKLLG